MSTSWFTRILTLGNEGADVRLVQRKLKCRTSGTYDPETAARVRGVQKLHGLPITGMVDTTTAEKIGESIRYGLVPDWYTREIDLHDIGDDVRRLTDMLGLAPTDHFDAEVAASVRRYQSAHSLPLTGRITEMDAIQIGDDVNWQNDVVH